MEVPTGPSPLRLCASAAAPVGLPEQSPEFHGAHHLREVAWSVHAAPPVPRVSSPAAALTSGHGDRRATGAVVQDLVDEHGTHRDSYS